MDPDARQRHESAGTPGHAERLTARELAACASLGHLLAAKGRSVCGMSPFELDDALDTIMALFDRL